jgi:hypothetical protein
MALKKDIADRMRDAGHTAKEIREFASAKKPDGSPQDLDLIVQSATFEHMLDSRRKWVERALSPKATGGMGLTYRQAMKIIDEYYVMKGRRKHRKSIFDWLKISYRPKDKIKSKKKFQEAITAKSMIGKALGKGYGERLKIRYAPRNATRRCQTCHGTGTMINLENRRQTCWRCGGTGVQGQRFP